MNENGKYFFVKITSCYLGVTIDDINLENVSGIEQIEKFMNDPDSIVLYSFSKKDEYKNFKFSLQINGNECDKYVVFSKYKKSALRDDNLDSSVQVTCLSGSPSLAMYTSLNIFTPFMLNVLGNDENFQHKLLLLQNDLRSTLVKEGDDAELQDLPNPCLRGVNSLRKEIEYWKNVANTSKNRTSKSSGEVFSSLLEPLEKELSLLDVLSLHEIDDVLEVAHSVLDDLWHHQLQFPQERMQLVFDSIGAQVIKSLLVHIRKINIWEEDYNKVVDVLSQSKSVGEHLIVTCRQLTEIFWPNYSPHLWIGEFYVPKDLEKFVSRLDEIIKIRTLHKQLLKLLTPDERDELNTDRIFEPFHSPDVNAFEQHDTTDNSWLKATKQFESSLQPAEQKVALKLKKQLSGINVNIRQLLHEFGRYVELISRPILKQSLLIERQQLLTSLFDYVRSLQTQTSTENSHLSIKYDTPEVVSEVLLIKQLESKAGEVQRISERLLDDLQGFASLNEIVSELLKNLKQQLTELIDSWTEEITMKIKQNKLSLKESDPVIKFSDNKLMKVNYSPRLVTLISEVRQLQALGFHVPNHIQQIGEHAKKFMRYAKTLEQIANFHNTFGDRMITSQRPMMLASAVELSKLVQEQEVVSWDDTRAVENYIGTLKSAVDKLSRENNLLASYHYQVMNQIKQLENVDLIKDYSKWKEGSKEIKRIMSQVEEKGFRNMTIWKNDIDQKLCQVLEKQYVKSLGTVHLYLPEIYADLVYRKSELRFSPSEEELKEKYDQQLRRFLDIPKNFRGIVEFPEKNIYAGIIEKSSNELSRVDKQTEKLFEELHNVMKHWEAWLQLEPLDVTKLSTWQHWDIHFRASKTFGQEIAKLPSTEEKVGCFLIGLSRLISDLESHNRSYWDQLVQSLKDSIVEDVVKLQNFVDPSTASLTKQPVTIEEIGEAGVFHANILKQLPEMESTFDQMLLKSRTLSGWTREQVDSVNRLKGAWERLQSLLENYQHIISKQIETIKTTLDIESENLNKELERFGAKWEQVKPRPHSGEISDGTMSDLCKQLESIKEKKAQWAELTEKKNKLTTEFTKYGIEEPRFPLSDEIGADIEKEEKNWALFEEFREEIENLANEEWIVFRKKIYLFEEVISKWQAKLKDVEQTDHVIRILQELNKYEEVAPILKYVRGEDFTDKHWTDVSNTLGIDLNNPTELKFRDFLDVSEKLTLYSQELLIICRKAASEIIVRQALAELDQWDVQARFTLIPHANSQNKTMQLIKEFKEVLSKIGDNQSLLQSVKNCADYESFSERATIWENKLIDLDGFVSSLAQIQRKWLYLEPIFGSGTLIQEKSRFDKLDKEFRHVLLYIEKDSRVSVLCRYPNLRSLLENIQNQLARCQNSLDNFLTEKRNKFPRFLFLNDDDLLEVVGQSSKEQVIQTHLKKLFAGINSIQLNGAGRNITAMCSLHGEVVPLSNPINIERPVEDWLNSLVKEMQITLKDLLVHCRDNGELTDPLNYPSQILCLIDGINFTSKCEQAISNMTLPPLLATYKAQLTHYSSLELNSDDEKLLSSLNVTISEDEEMNVLELKLQALLLDTIHHISVIEELLDHNVTKTSDWIWQKQLRFYANSTGEVTVKMANARMDYAYEYLGNAPKLVRTPLTDKCFLTLTQGLHLGMGGNPYGPAGTGKTESVKALGGLLGRQVLVFNCDEGIDASSMGRILCGLVKSGAWGCFDEFNRLDEATLSAISMYIHPIQVSLRTGASSVKLFDQEVPVNRHCGIFVTLNPAGGGYGGRNKLPDNLKQLFRPVVMTHPDHEEIAKCLLHCDGYQNAAYIARKLIEVFNLSSKLLSKQQHYDWGLRALRTVLIGCGRAMKVHRKRPETTGSNILDMELKLVVRTLRINTLSKLTFKDSVAFDGLIGDVFKGIPLEDVGNNVLINALESSFAEMNLTVNKRQIKKCLELYEQLKQRMGIAIVGPPRSGKSTVRNLLFNALIKMGRTVKKTSVNPKSMSKVQLLGEVDASTRQWNDGVLTFYSLQIASEPTNVWSWMVCDGNIDPEWVESLNSVLDDNRLLTLPSGWRIQFGPNVNFLFETHDLSHASPATISRMGIVFLSDADVSVGDYVGNYVKNCLLDGSGVGVIETLVEEYFFKALDYTVKENMTSRSQISLSDTVLSQMFDVKSKSQFIVRLVNGFCCQIAHQFRADFTQKIFESLNEPTPPIITNIRYNEDRDMIESHFTNPNITFDDSTDLELPLLLTGQIQNVLETLSFWLERDDQHFFIVGEHGSAKTLLLRHLVQELAELDMTTIYCNANLKPEFIITKMSQNCILVHTNKGKVYRPKRGRLVLHMKNLHLLKPDKWGTNILIEFLHQIITYKGFYDSNLEFIGLENVTIAGSAESLSNLSPRLTSLVHVCNINPPEQEDLSLLVVSYLSLMLRKLAPDITWPKAKITKLAASMISVHEKTKNAFTGSGSVNFKCFDSHDLIKWCSGILYYQADVESNEMEQFIIEIVCNEALKLFCDKFDKEEDVTKFHQIFNEVFSHHWSKSNLTKSIENFYYVPQQQLTSPKFQKLNHQDWYNLIQKGITLCEREGRTLDVIVNNEIMDLSASISRAVARENGNLVLIGRSGVGRKSSVRIVSALQSAKLVALTSNQKIQFNNDLKLALQHSGLEGDDQPVYLLLEDHILNKENILSVLNTLICSGEAPGLYNPVEMDSLVAGLKEEAARHNFEGNLFEFFAQRVRRNLHVILCLDVENDDLTSVFESCPALYRNCGLVWKYSWSPATLEGIPKIIINRINETNRSAKKIQQCEDFVKIFQEIEFKSAAPFRFVAMVKLYCEIYSDKFTSIAANQNKLQAGVSKLTEAHNLVTSLKEEAANQQKKLAEKQAKANNALDMITNTMKNANSHKEEMESLKQITEHENVKIMKRKQEIDEELSEVEPLIQEARSAVGNIKPESLSEIRSLRAPPDVIRDILEGVLRLMGIQDTSWNSMKTFLAKRGVKEEIRSFDASKITPESRQAVERLMSTKKDSFDPKAAKRASVAAAPLASWVSANVKYSLVMDKIRPLEREQSKLQKNLVQAENQLGELSAGLLDVDATVSKLKAQLSAYTKEAAEIEIGLNKAQEMLASAEGLVSKLQDEYKRWQEQLKELSSEIEHLPRNCLLASAYITYLSNESEEGRRVILNKWLQALKTPKFDIKQFLSSERQELQWQSEGLSQDNISLQNAIIILKTNIIPLLIDPTSMAVDWIKSNNLKSKQFEKIAQSSNKFNTTLELAIRFGKTLIIEEVEDISPILLPILRKEIAYQGERKLINLHGKQIDYHQDFRVILCSRNEQLRLKPNEEAVIAMMNFTVTRSGLTEQLLNRAIRQEKPELETRQKQLLSENEDLHEKQHNLQNQLLEDLANSKGNILQNTSLLKSLNEAKASSVSIAGALEELTRVQGKLQKEYDVYREVAMFASNLYFAVNEFSKLNILYLTSVPACTRLFLKSLQTFQATDSKVILYKKYLLQTFYNFISRGIFKDDRIKFALHLVQKMFPDEVPSNEWNIFLGSYLSTTDDFEDTPLWIPEQRRSYLQKLQVLPDLYSALKLNEQAPWNNFMNVKDCELHFPAHCKVTEFQKVLLVQALRPDRLYSSISLCILHLTGLKNLEPAVTELSSVWKESVPKEPILLLITSGNDPSSAIISIAQAQMGVDQYKEIAMGEGQEDFAIETLQKCADSGKWLILKNLHLVRKWLPLLCQKIQNVQPKASFRLWLITEPHNEFNFVLAQNSLKIAYESPQGIKNNLLHTYAARGGKYFEKLSPNSARIFFVMSCVHALLQERRTYIPQGWSKWYEFSDTDFSTLISLIEDLWQSSSTIQTQWRFISGLHSDTVYGGRIEKASDLKVLRAYLRKYCLDEVLSHRWRPFDMSVNLPTTSKYQDYINVIIQLPGKDSPAYFGLPENIGSALEKQMSTILIENLKNLHHLSKTVTSKFNRELWYKGLSPLINVWKKINQGRDFVRMTFPDDRRKESPVEIFFVEEFKWAVDLIQLIHRSFSSLNRICKSLLPPDENQLIDGKALMNYEVPKSWSGVWDGPKDPSQYLINVVDKTDKLSKWYDQDVREILQNALNLSHIFHPEAFLASYKQEYSRTSNIPIDELVLSTTWRARPPEKFSVSITNLFIEGGIFDGNELKPCKTGTENTNPAPDCFINWRQKSDTESVEEEKLTKVPLFYSPLREKQLTSLQVPCRAVDKDQWVLAGLAFYLEH